MVNVNNDELTLGQYNADADYSESKCEFVYFKRSLFFQGKGFCLFCSWLAVLNSF